MLTNEISIGSLNDLARLEAGGQVIAPAGGRFGYVSDTRQRPSKIWDESYRRSYPAWVNNDSILVATCRPREIVAAYWSWRCSPKPKPEYISFVLGVSPEELDSILRNVRRRKPIIVGYDPFARDQIMGAIYNFLGAYNEHADRTVVKEYDTVKYPVRHCKGTPSDCPVCNASPIPEIRGYDGPSVTFHHDNKSIARLLKKDMAESSAPVPESKEASEIRKAWNRDHCNCPGCKLDRHESQI